MGLLLIAASEPTGLLTWLWVIFQVAAGLGFVIFVHELGHFAVAKWCGVQCDKFFIGFDIFGLKLWSKKIGETEYGIGIVPLGGYVKMLGQDDNPANVARELERARQAQESGDAASSGYVLNPRSYIAKSVPQRMAIISAGVIMNVIFAFIFATIAYCLGVKYEPCVVSGVVPGSPAWQAGLAPGDEIVQIDNIRKPRFLDLKYGVSLGDLESGVPMVIKTPADKEFDLTLKPVQKKEGGLPTIGVLMPNSLKIYDVLPNTPAALAKPAFEGGDQLLAVNGEPLTNYTQLLAVLARDPEKPLKLKVQRAGKEENAPPQELEIEVGANPMKRLGLVMKIGAITGVQDGSPAAEAGLKPADFIVQINGEAIGDPETLPDRLRKLALAGESVTLTVQRAAPQGRSETHDITVVPRVPISIESPMPGGPISAPALGIAYRILNRVHAVEPGSPAEKAKLVSGDVILSARLLLTDEMKKDLTSKQIAEREKPIEFGENSHNWPGFVQGLQRLAPKIEIELTVQGGENAPERKVTLCPADSTEWFNPERGWWLEPMQRIRKADSFTDAIALGGRETKESLLMVYRFVQKLGEGQIPMTALGGPGTIAQAAGYAAFDGPATLLIFLTMLSANLAVVNFLPIPILDGGHMVFLILEGIMRRPVNERIVVALTTLGFACIVGLMLFVIALDLGIISRNL